MKAPALKVYEKLIQARRRGLHAAAPSENPANTQGASSMRLAPVMRLIVVEGIVALAGGGFFLAVALELTAQAVDVGEERG
jgi:hypothetical protein